MGAEPRRGLSFRTAAVRGVCLGGVWPESGGGALGQPGGGGAEAGPEAPPRTVAVLKAEERLAC